MGGELVDREGSAKHAHRRKQSVARAHDSEISSSEQQDDHADGQHHRHGAGSVGEHEERDEDHQRYEAAGDRQ